MTKDKAPDSAKISRTSMSEGYTRALARDVARLLRAGDVLLLEGGMGVGKTTFTRELGAALGVAPGLVASPTFVVINQYPCTIEGRPGQLVHVDAYRLRSGEELGNMGWDECFTTAGDPVGNSVAAVEWPERLGGVFAAARSVARFLIEVSGEARRVFTLGVPRAWAGRPEFEMIRNREPTACPVTGVLVEATRATYPFADEKAKLADLGRWMSGSYRIAREVRPDELDEPT